MNNTSIGVCFCGDFDANKPSQKQYNALNQLLIDLSKKYTFTVHYHNEYSTKSCPGKNFDYTKVQSPFINIKEIIMSYYKDLYKKEVTDPKVIKDVEKAISVCVKPDGTVVAEELMYFIALAAERAVKAK